MMIILYWLLVIIVMDDEDEINDVGMVNDDVLIGGKDDIRD